LTASLLLIYVDLHTGNVLIDIGPEDMLLQNLANADPSKDAVSRPFNSAGIDNITVRLTDFGVGKTPRIEALDNNS
jgi:hypothetical protein